MHYEWDERKNRENIRKHGVSFQDAQEVFHDPFHLSLLDERFDYLEERWITIGLTRGKQIIVIGHLYYLKENGDEIIQIKTARKATNKEREHYENIG
jgi:hypothetical protein